jgi:DNA primase
MEGSHLRGNSTCEPMTTLAKRHPKRDLTVEELHQALHPYLGSGIQDGRRYWYNCSFHVDKTPSLNIYETEKGARLKCLGCSWSGDIYDFIMQYTGATFPAAIEIAQNSLGDVRNMVHAAKQPHKKEKILNISAETRTQIYTELIRYTTLSVVGAKYLEGERGLDVEQCCRLGLRCFGDGEFFRVQNHMKKTFSESDLIAAGFYVRDKQAGQPYFSLIGFRGRILIPYHWGSRIVGLQGRAISEEQAKFGKYKTAWIPSLYIPPGTERRNDIPLCICEGAFDAIADHTNGGRAIGFSTASISEEKIKRAAAKFIRINPCKISIAIEDDEAGCKLKELLKTALEAQGFPCGRVQEWDKPIGVKDLCDYYRLPTEPTYKQSDQKINEVLGRNSEVKKMVDQVLSVFTGASIVSIDENQPPNQASC